MGSISEQISWRSLRQNTSEQIMSASVEGLPVGQWMRSPQTQEDCSCFKGAHTNYMPGNLFTVVNPGVIHAQYVINIIFTFNLSFLGTCPQVFLVLSIIHRRVPWQRWCLLIALMSLDEFPQWPSGQLPPFESSEFWPWSWLLARLGEAQPQLLDWYTWKILSLSCIQM